MNEENQITEQQAEVTPVQTEQERQLETNPMLSRNAPKEGVPPQAPEEKQVEAPREAEPKLEGDKPQAQSELSTKAASIDILDSFNDDPQFKPIAMYLDTQLADVDTARAFGLALERGDVTLIDRAYLTEKLGDKANEIIGLSTSLFEAASAKATAEVNSVYAEFGGQDVVKQAITFFNEKGNPNDRKALASMLDSGVKDNIAYAMRQIVNFSKQSGGVVTKGASIPMGQPSAQRGLSADEYRAAVSKLTSSPKRGSDAEYARLFDARQLGVTQGL